MMGYFVVMLDLQFLGIHVEADNARQAQDKALKALDNLHTEREASGVTGIEYGLRNVKIIQPEETPEK